jgi:hypothetical protein
MNRSRTHYESAVAALEAQGFRSPGPKLIERVMDAIGRVEEETPAGERRHEYDYAELLADTPELVDRTEGPLNDDPATEYRGGPQQRPPLRVRRRRF